MLTLESMAITTLQERGINIAWRTVAEFDEKLRDTIIKEVGTPSKRGVHLRVFCKSTFNGKEAADYTITGVRDPIRVAGVAFLVSVSLYIDDGLMAIAKFHDSASVGPKTGVIESVEEGHRRIEQAWESSGQLARDKVLTIVPSLIAQCFARADE